MKKIFYRFNNDIYIDYQAITDWAQEMGVDQASTRELCLLKSRLEPHTTEEALLLAN